MDPEDIQRRREAMPDIGLVRSFGPVDQSDESASETMFYIEGDNGGVRFTIDAVRAEDLRDEFDRLADELAVNE